MPYIYGQIYKYSDHFIAFFLGRPNSSKSWSALSLCVAVDPTFTKERIFFRTEDYLRYIKLNKPPPGSAFLIDEATRTLSNRNFMQKRQKRFVVFSHAARVLGHIICYTAPVDALDSQLTPLLHMKASDGEIDRSRGVAHFQVKINSFKMNIQTKQPIFDFLTVLHNNQEIEIDSIAFPKPPVKLRNEYKHMKMQNVWDLVEEGIGEEELEDARTPGHEDLEPYILKVLAGGTTFLNTKGRFDPDEIQLQFKTTGQLAKRIKKQADKRLEGVALV